MLDGFKTFILRGNVVDLAVAVVIGAAFGAVVTSFVENILTPLIGAMGGQPDFSSIMLGPLAIGAFLNSIVSFLLIALVIYFLVVAPMNRLNERLKPSTPDPAPTRQCPECLSDIPVEATRCAFCTTRLSALPG